MPGPLDQPWRFRELLTMEQAGASLQKSGEAFRVWARRHGVPMSKVGREWRVDRRDLDRFIDEETKRALKVS